MREFQPDQRPQGDRDAQGTRNEEVRLEERSDFFELIDNYDRFQIRTQDVAKLFGIPTDDYTKMLEGLEAFCYDVTHIYNAICSMNVSTGIIYITKQSKNLN